MTTRRSYRLLFYLLYIVSENTLARQLVSCASSVVNLGMIVEAVGLTRTTACRRTFLRINLSRRSSLVRTQLVFMPSLRQRSKRHLLQLRRDFESTGHSPESNRDRPGREPDSNPSSSLLHSKTEYCPLCQWCYINFVSLCFKDTRVLKHFIEDIVSSKQTQQSMSFLCGQYAKQNFIGD
jgi:hypothetical protein